MGRGARHQTDAPADPVEQPELVAAALYEAETAAKGLSGQSVGDGLSGADVQWLRAVVQVTLGGV